MLRGPVWGGQLISEAYVNKRGPPRAAARELRQIPRALLLTPTTKERRTYFHNKLLQLPGVEVDDVLLAVVLLLDRVPDGLLLLNNFLLFRRRRRLRSLLLRLRRGPPVR